jgi:hypothetical protein
MGMKKRDKILIILILIFLALFMGCKPKAEIKDKEIAIEECKKVCEKARKEIELNSQCLSDIYDWKIEDWVCDIAHWPRESIDNLPENQCSAFREGKAKHFVELDSDCKFIRAY